MTGNQLKALRMAVGLTQPALAQACGVSPAIIGVWEQKGEASAVPQRKSRKWDATVAYLAAVSPSTPSPAAAPGPVDPISAVTRMQIAAAREIEPDHYEEGILWPYYPTAGPAYRERIRAAMGVTR